MGRHVNSLRATHPLGRFLGRSLRRGRPSRGVIALVFAMMLPIICGLMIGIADLGMLYLRRYELQNGAEEQALTQALYVMASPSSANNQRPEVTQVSRGNSRWAAANGDNIDYAIGDWNLRAMSTITPGNPWANSEITWAWWAPNAATEMVGSWSPLSQFFTSMQPTQVRAWTRAAVPQFTWTQFQPLRARIILVLDFSSTMLESFGGGGGPSAISILRNTVQTVLQGTDTSLSPVLYRRINWGAVLFSEAVWPNMIVQPVPLPSQSTVADIDQNLYNLNAQKIVANMAAQRCSPPPGSPPGTPGWRATNLADAIDTAVKLLDNHASSTGSSFARKYEAGPGFLLIISDGEPSWVNSYDFDQASYQGRVDAARIRAQNSAQNAWNRGYTTLTITVQTNVNNDMAAINTFAANISGSSAGPNTPQFAFDDAHIPQLLAGINPATHCLSDPQMKMLSYPTTWASPPLNIDLNYYPFQHSGDNVFGFASTMGGATTAGSDWSVARGQNPNVRGFDPAPIAASPYFPTDPKNQAFYMYPSDPGQINTGQNMVELNVGFCLPYLMAQKGSPSEFAPVATPGAKTPIFRARWGYPRMPQTGFQGYGSYPYR